MAKPKLLSPAELMQKKFEPKFNNRFLFEIDGIPSFLCSTGARPSVSIDTVEIPYLNVVRKLSTGKPTFDSISVTLHDPIEESGVQIVMNWLYQHVEITTGRSGYSDIYKKDITLNILGSAGDIIEKWIYHNCHLESTNFGDLDWSGADVMNIEITFAYDYPELIY